MPEWWDKFWKISEFLTLSKIHLRIRNRYWKLIWLLIRRLIGYDFRPRKTALDQWIIALLFYLQAIYKFIVLRPLRRISSPTEKERLVQNYKSRSTLKFDFFPIEQYNNTIMAFVFRTRMLYVQKKYEKIYYQYKYIFYLLIYIYKLSLLLVI